MSKAWAGGSTRRWRRVRAAVLLRDGYACRLRLPGCTATATQAHHVHGRGRCAGCRADDPSHIEAACRHCNASLGDPGAARATREQRVDNDHVVTQW